MGRKLFEHSVPGLLKEFKRNNDLQEKILELKIKEISLMEKEISLKEKEISLKELSLKEI